ncbi:methylmalonyl-CoA epimerase [Chlorobaculum thiosulfatiphilum]|jgi:methylmalonyl-CoA/ethylmalonyl-CoA epimerase|uniref:Methylmalonyl-CoA epimerase n=1 Tax=Chlorobaculum thiosulfatiphilum TaxID=115852 RepID=A0A5C4S4Q7_CHLTI|nr:methylmalonyl-CoA epimerase [Chlorobaculum thiosulfatiphilum]TNJ38450.1 methylmalonyl-CoA epimerase [Chlorobaculum thiosulfatiphilum]
MIDRIDHIAIAVEHLDSAIDTWTNLLGCDRSAVTIHEVPSEKVRAAFIAVGQTKIELLEPLGDDGPIAKFLSKNGEGMHHIALATDDAAAEAERAAALGITPLGEPSTGAGGKKIVFLHPRQTNRVLVEFVEPKPDHSFIQ